MMRCVGTVRVWTPAIHKFIVLHDKRARRALSPGDIVLAHEIIAQFRTISKTQQLGPAQIKADYPVRVVADHLISGEMQELFLCRTALLPTPILGSVPPH